MLIKFGEYEPSSRPKKAIFMCVISLYFSSFFIDHPVGKMNNIVYFFGCGLQKVCLKPKNKYLS